MHTLLSTLGLRNRFNNCCIYEEEFRFYEEEVWLNRETNGTIIYSNDLMNIKTKQENPNIIYILVRRSYTTKPRQYKIVINRYVLDYYGKADM